MHLVNMDLDCGIANWTHLAPPVVFVPSSDIRMSSLTNLNLLEIHIARAWAE